MRILAIETSCDETAAAVIIDGKIKSNIIASQAETLHRQYGGVVPEVAAREHVSVIIPTIDLALKQAKMKLTNIDVIAVTQGPGLATSLMVGIDTAHALGLALNKPVLPVNHLEAHIYANFVSPVFASEAKQSQSKKEIASSSRQIGTPRKDKLIFPAIILLVSGGHTMLVLMRKHGDYRIIGETLDDAAGEAFDKTAKMLGLGYPGGPRLSKLAEKGNPAAFNFPRPMIKFDNFEFSFSGLKTSVLYELLKHKTISYKLKANFAASVQQAIVDVLIAKLEKAIIRFKPKTIMLGGGVAANKLLRKRFQLLTNHYPLTTSIPALEYCTDNAAMIGLAAYYRIKNKKAKFSKTFSAQPNLPLK